MYRSRLFTTLTLLLLIAGATSAQTRPSATPVSAVLLSPTPDRPQASAPTAVPGPSATPLPSARLQALDSAGSVNVRARPDINSEVQGTIAFGTEYPVLRNYFRWYELIYEPSANGRAWVYGDLVTITGDRSRIEIIEDPNAIAQPAVNNQASAADERTIDISTLEADSAQSVELLAATALPTFTYVPTRPPFTQRQATDQAAERADATLPPIVPILALGGFGLLGLLISLLRS